MGLIPGETRRSPTDRRVAVSAEFDSCVADEVFRLGDDDLILFFSGHVGADGSFDAFHQVGLFWLFEPGFDLRGVTLFLLLILHFSQEELPLQLLAGEFLDVFDQAGFCLHEGVQSGIYFGVDFELLCQFFFLFW